MEAAKEKRNLASLWFDMFRMSLLSLYGELSPVLIILIHFLVAELFYQQLCLK